MQTGWGGPPLRFVQGWDSERRHYRILILHIPTALEGRRWVEAAACSVASLLPAYRNPNIATHWVAHPCVLRKGGIPEREHYRILILHIPTALEGRRWAEAAACSVASLLPPIGIPPLQRAQGRATRADPAD